MYNPKYSYFMNGAPEDDFGKEYFDTRPKYECFLK